MADPRRIQFRRIKGWRLPADAVYVGRPSRWGNPYKIVDESQRATVIELFRTWLRRYLQINNAYLEPLIGKRLACPCPLDLPCHVDVILEVLDRGR